MRKCEYATIMGNPGADDSIQGFSLSISYHFDERFFSSPPPDPLIR